MPKSLLQNLVKVLCGKTAKRTITTDKDDKSANEANSRDHAKGDPTVLVVFALPVTASSQRLARRRERAKSPFSRPIWRVRFFSHVLVPPKGQESILPVVHDRQHSLNEKLKAGPTRRAQ
jgi:hypothetical protein